MTFKIFSASSLAEELSRREQQSSAQLSAVQLEITRINENLVRIHEILFGE